MVLPDTRGDREMTVLCQMDSGMNDSDGPYMSLRELTIYPLKYCITNINYQTLLLQQENKERNSIHAYTHIHIHKSSQE